MTPFALALIALWLTVKSERANNLTACQVFSLAAGFVWGMAFVMLLNLWLPI
jgi:hypothetical protein